MGKKTAIAGTIGVVALAAAGIFVFGVPKAQVVDFASAQYGDMALSIDIDGIAKRDVKMPVTSAFSGKVVTCVKEGDTISVGDLLLEIDDGTKQQLAQAQVELSREKDNATKSVSVMSTEKGSKKSESSTQKEYDLLIAKRNDVVSLAQKDFIEYEKYNAAVKAALEINSLQVMADVNSSESTSAKKQTKTSTASNDAKINWINDSINKLEEKLPSLRTVSQIQGVVLRADVKSGTELNEGEVALVIGSKGVSVVAKADEQLAPQIKPGMEARITLEGKTWKSTVSSVKGTDVFINAPEGFESKDGTKVSVRVLTATAKDVIKLPTECVAIDAQGAYVLVYEGGKLARRNVQTGLVDDFSVTVTEGLGVAEQCAYYPEQLEEGIKVKTA